MEKLKVVSVILIIIGFILCLFGWTQSWGSVTGRVMETYVFVTAGFIVFVISGILHKLIMEMEKENTYIMNRLIQLEQRIKQLENGKGNRYERKN